MSAEQQQVRAVNIMRACRTKLLERRSVTEWSRPHVGQNDDLDDLHPNPPF